MNPGSPFTLHLGDSREVLKGMAEASIDAEIARARIEFARRQGHQPSLLEAA